MTSLSKISGLLLNKQSKPLWLIVAYFLFVLLFVSLKGNFPLNDDWSYGESVRNLLQTGQFNMPNVCAIGLTHVMLGALFCKIFGFSYVVLRACVFAFAVIGGFALYGALREVGLHRWVAAFCSLIYVCNPLMVNLSVSFMTDITALSLVNVYLYLLLLSVRKNSIKLAILSIITLVLAIGARQSVIIFMPCNLSLLVLRVNNREHLNWLLLASLVIPVLCYIGADQWLIQKSISADGYLEVRERHVQFVQTMWSSPTQWLYALIVALGESICYLGLFCSPILLVILWQAKSILTKYISSFWYWLLAAGTVVAISAFQLVVVQSKLMPFNQNLLRLPMVCALTIMGLNMPLLASRNLKWITALSFLLAFVLLIALGFLLQISMNAAAKYFHSGKGTIYELAIFWICGVSTVASIIFGSVETVIRCTDRYYLIALGPILLSLSLLCRCLKVKILQPISIMTLVLIAIYSACAAQDYLGWNRARWIGLGRLEAKGIPSNQIDGGYEYNTLRDMTIYGSPNHGLPPRNGWRWWAVKGETYIVSFSPIPGYKITDRLHYWSALGFKQREVLILESENK